MQFFLNQSRRAFLRTAAAAIGSLFLPKSLFSRKPENSFWFIHADSGNSWSVDYPVQWCLQNAHEPLLERAAERLQKLTPNDGDRIIRLVTRRCRLNLIELQPERVVTHHWSHLGLADLRGFFKSHRLARPEIEVVLRDRKKELVATRTGDEFLYGDLLAANFPLDVFLSKWVNRMKREADDWLAAPGTRSGYAWEGVENNRIPWAALKSAWRRTSPALCKNCDQPTILTNFGYPRVSMFNRSPMFVRVCGVCHRSFRGETVKDVAGWMAANLDGEVQPDFEMVWNRRVKLEPKA